MLKCSRYIRVVPNSKWGMARDCLVTNMDKWHNDLGKISRSSKYPTNEYGLKLIVMKPVATKIAKERYKQRNIL